jgi:hypothetical protein
MAIQKNATLAVDVASYDAWDTGHQYPHTFLFAGDHVAILAETEDTITVSDGDVTETIARITYSGQPTVNRYR